MSKINPFTGDLLLIEEDDKYRAELVKYLKGIGIPVTGLPSEHHAFKFMQSQPWSWYPSAIICDISMSGMGGYEFSRRMSESYPKRDIIKILHSKLNSGTDIIEGELAGAHGFIKKPCDFEKLYLALVKIVKNSKSEKGILVFDD